MRKSAKISISGVTRPLRVQLQMVSQAPVADLIEQVPNIDFYKIGGNLNLKTEEERTAYARYFVANYMAEHMEYWRMRGFPYAEYFPMREPEGFADETDPTEQGKVLREHCRKIFENALKADDEFVRYAVRWIAGKDANPYTLDHVMSYAVMAWSNLNTLMDEKGKSSGLSHIIKMRYSDLHPSFKNGHVMDDDIQRDGAYMPLSSEIEEKYAEIHFGMAFGLLDRAGVACLYEEMDDMMRAYTHLKFDPAAANSRKNVIEVTFKEERWSDILRPEGL